MPTISAQETPDDLLAALRDALHVLDELESDTRGRVEAEAGLEEARAAYDARIGGLEETHEADKVRV